MGLGESQWTKHRFMPGWRRYSKTFLTKIQSQVTPELSAKDVDGWDSLTHIRLMLTIEKAFKIKFSVRRLANWKMSATW